MATVLVSNVDKKAAAGELPVRLCNYTDVYYQQRLDQSLDYMAATATADQRRTFGLRVGDTVITKDSETADEIGVAALVTESAPDFVCGYHLAILRPRPALEPRYLYWQVASRFVQVQLATRASGVTRYGLTYDAIRGVRLVMRPFEQQRRIADFLDDQIARLTEAMRWADALELQVAERAQATLDSLFDGTGVRLRCKDLLAQFPQYGVLVPELVDEGVPFIRIKDLADLPQAPSASLAAIPASQSAEYRRTVVRAGDVLVGVVGSTDKTAIVPERLAGANIARAVARLVPAKGVPSPVLFGWLGTTDYRRQAAAATASDTAQPTLNMSDLRNFPVPLPAGSLQTLADRVDQVLAWRQEASTAAAKQRQLLEERKRALITTCVTGEFDISAASDRAGDAALAHVPAAHGVLAE